MKVCVIGLGTVGFHTVVYMKKYKSVCGYDIDFQRVKKASQYFPATDKWRDIPPDIKTYIICVGTGNKYPDTKAVFDVSEKIKEKMQTDTLISVESTVPPGTCRKIAKDFGFKRLVCCPHRFWIEDKERCGIRQLRVLGGINDESIEAGLRFYKSVEIPIHAVSTIEVAELCKIVENSYRYVQIALAEELKMLCYKLGLGFQELREACNTKWNVELLEARDGIGGHCLPKDILMLSSLLSSPSIFLEAIKLDRMYRKWLRRGKFIE